MRVGQIIDGKWSIEDVKGRGGQGEVFRVRETNSNEVFALKFLNKQNDIERRSRMYREVCNVKLLSNNHLMSIVYSNAEKHEDLTEKLYYVSKYIEGKTLEEYVEENNITLIEALSFFKEFLDVLEYCHTKGILHRDIKPDNILLMEGKLGEFVLIDFGLSFNVEDNEEITPTDQQLGNRFLLLPELVSGNNEQKRSFEGFDLNQYLNTTFRMFNSQHEEVELICSNDLMDAIIDRFGEDVITYAYDMESFRVVVSVALSHVFYSWVFGFEGKVKIKGPIGVKEKYKAMVQTALNII